ncbi:MAG: hypothetical protein IJG48_09430 [Mogibacterium sp.]|nr:hypothetical protein [Mogibacterium sp.]
MAKVNIIRRAARIAKSILLPADKARLEKRIEFSRKQIHKRRKNNKRRNIAERNVLIMDETGMTKEEINEKLQHFRDMNITQLSHNLFKAFGLYKMDDEEAVKVLYKLKELKDLEYDLRWDYRLWDLGLLSFEDVEENSTKFKKLYGELLTKDGQLAIVEKAGYLHPETFDDNQLRDLAADMEFTRSILRFTRSQYAQFHFYDKSIPERRTFVANLDRDLLRSEINTRDSVAILDDKLMTYEHLSKFFGRDLVSIAGETDYFKFKRFFENNDAGVLKPRFESLGKGIRLIHKSEFDEAGMGKAFISLVDEYRRFLLEGYINAAEEIRRLNPDSVNTVRVMAYYDGEKTTIFSVSMRIGHAGSFVDNAGAGGITVAIDKETGRIDSDGYDEKGLVYECHPDNGIKLKGYQLPAWDKALATVEEISRSLEGAKFVGWDLACTDKYEWVLVEGNGRSGFFGAQAPHDKGRLKEFLELTGSDPRGAVCRGIARETAKRIRNEEEIPVEDTMEMIYHFESLGLDGRYFYECRAWEKSDEELLALKDKYAVQNRINELHGE